MNVQNHLPSHANVATAAAEARQSNVPNTAAEDLNQSANAENRETKTSQALDALIESSQNPNAAAESSQSVTTPNTEAESSQSTNVPITPVKKPCRPRAESQTGVEVTIRYGPYEACGIVDHRLHRLQGMQRNDMLINCTKHCLYYVLTKLTYCGILFFY